MALTIDSRVSLAASSVYSDSCAVYSDSSESCQSDHESIPITPMHPLLPTVGFSKDGSGFPQFIEPALLYQPDIGDGQKNFSYHCRLLAYWDHTKSEQLAGVARSLGNCAPQGSLFRNYFDEDCNLIKHNTFRARHPHLRLKTVLSTIPVRVHVLDMVSDSWAHSAPDAVPWDSHPPHQEPYEPKPESTRMRYQVPWDPVTKKARPTKTSDDKIGDYHLGHTLGEGEFGKVRIGWRITDRAKHPKDEDQTVAVKVINRNKLNSPGRLSKVYREIAILGNLNHPNIVHLHQMVQTESTFGIVLDYASGGELFDYILQNRYLNDKRAQKLFSELISGVGYLHQYGIIHRDLKLENLLLDSKLHIIITDFGFANNFDPTDKLPAGAEDHLHDREYIDYHGLDKEREDHMKRGDLMSTSCGSPCYAAPELVVSDGLYMGRKVDIWSCGVILYAMLAGYLPFDDDPANPEGDNINLLYKYICNTPLVFPEYVTPCARDLLKLILVPDPKHRADLFKISCHTWLMEYQHDILRGAGISQKGTPLSAEQNPIALPHLSEVTHPEMFSQLPRATSLKEASPPIPQSAAQSTGVEESPARPSRNVDRRTIQVEYVAPQSQPTHRTDAAAGPDSRSPKGRHVSQGRSDQEYRPVPPEKDYLPPKVPAKDYAGKRNPRATSESTAYMSGQSNQVARPSTGGSAGTSRLPPSRGSYGQPSAAAVAPTMAEGRFSQPRPGSHNRYNITNPMPHTQSAPNQQPVNDPSTDPYRPSLEQSAKPRRGHKRATTLGGIGDKLLGRASSTRRGDGKPKPDRSYPPTSMRPVEADSNKSRQSSESARRSFGFHRKSSDVATKEKRTSRRFSLLPRSKGNDTAQQHSSQPVNPPITQPTQHNNYVDGNFETYNNYEKRGPLPGKTKRFNDAYEKREGAGSSGAARRVMELFRRRK